MSGSAWSKGCKILKSLVLPIIFGESGNNGIEWGPWQSAVPAGVLARECAAVKFLQRAWGRYRSRHRERIFADLLATIYAPSFSGKLAKVLQGSDKALVDSKSVERNQGAAAAVQAASGKASVNISVMGSTSVKNASIAKQGATAVPIHTAGCNDIEAVIEICQYAKMRTYSFQTPQRAKSASNGDKTMQRQVTALESRVQSLEAGADKLSVMSSQVSDVASYAHDLGKKLRLLTLLWKQLKQRCNCMGCCNHSKMPPICSEHYLCMHAS
jgi:hypothetical protein